MWCALAEAFENLGKYDQAILHYEFAVSAQDKEGIAVAKLAQLHASLGNKNKAEKYYLQLLSSDPENPCAGEALLYIAELSAERGERNLCVSYLDRLFEMGGDNETTRRGRQVLKSAGL